jgi:CBS domain containing-hemolysin-like protein
MDILLPSAVIAVLILINGLFVAAEFSIIGVRKSRMEHLAEEGDQTADWVRQVLDDSRKTDRWIATAQLGITLASLGLGMYAEPAITHLIEEPLHDWFGLTGAAVHTVSFVIALSIVTYLHVVLGEMVPKSMALQKPEGTVLSLTSPMRFSGRIFALPVSVLNQIGLLVLRVLRISAPSEGSRLYTPEDLEHIITESSAGGMVDDFEQELAVNIFDFSEQRVGHVMTHRTSITAIPVSASETDILELVASTPFSRVPVYRDDIDDIIGVLHVKDFVRQQLSETPYDLRALLREVSFVPETLGVGELLTEFRAQHQHLAIVVDEHGGTSGLVTLEDLIEEVVGEVQDEFDTEEEPPITVVAPGHLLVQGTVLLEDIDAYVAIGDHSHDVDTIGGVVMAELGRRPSEGDEVELGDVRLRVEAVERLSITRVSIHSPPGKAAPAYSRGRSR